MSTHCRYTRINQVQRQTFAIQIPEHSSRKAYEIPLQPAKFTSLNGLQLCGWRQKLHLLNCLYQAPFSQPSPTELSGSLVLTCLSLSNILKNRSTKLGKAAYFANTTFVQYNANNDCHTKSATQQIIKLSTLI